MELGLPIDLEIPGSNKEPGPRNPGRGENLPRMGGLTSPNHQEAVTCSEQWSAWSSSSSSVLPPVWTYQRSPHPLVSAHIFPQKQQWILYWAASWVVVQIFTSSTRSKKKWTSNYSAEAKSHVPNKNPGIRGQPLTPTWFSVGEVHVWKWHNS